MSELKPCPHLTSVHEYDGDPEQKCGLVPGLYCWGPDATHCPLKDSPCAGCGLERYAPTEHCVSCPKFKAACDYHTEKEKETNE